MFQSELDNGREEDLCDMCWGIGIEREMDAGFEGEPQYGGYDGPEQRGIIEWRAYGRRNSQCLRNEWV